jgi:hypothetical protein
LQRLLRFVGTLLPTRRAPRQPVEPDPEIERLDRIRNPHKYRPNND